MRLRPPSLISPPEPAVSPSLPEPAPPRERLRASEMVFCGTTADFRGGCEPARAVAVSGTVLVGRGIGDLGRDGGPLGVDMPVLSLEDSPCFFLGFLREDSLPLASERFGEPGRLRELEDAVRLRGSGSLLGRFEGVLVPFEEEPELVLSLDLSAALFSSASFLSCSSFRRSASVSDESLYVSMSVCYETDLSPSKLTSDE